MRLLLTKNGTIKRANIYDKDYLAIGCPFNTGEGFCGDWCAKCNEILKPVTGKAKLDVMKGRTTQEKAYRLIGFDLTCGAGTKLVDENLLIEER